MLDRIVAVIAIVGVAAVIGMIGFTAYQTKIANDWNIEQGQEFYNRAMEGDKTAAVAWCDVYGSRYTSEWCLNNFGFEIVQRDLSE